MIDKKARKFYLCRDWLSWLVEAWITWPLEIPLDSSLLDGYYVVERLLEKEQVTKLGRCCW